MTAITCWATQLLIPGYSPYGRNLTIESDQEDDGRWIAEVPALPGVLAYGASPAEAIARAKALALRVLAERLENGELVPETADLFSVVQ